MSGIASMITNLTKQDLIDFEQNILEEFEAGNIRAPVHLNGGNIDQLLEIFDNITEKDYVCCTWKSHLECLLRGVPPEELKEKILNGHSISLCFKKYKVISSAIVGGVCPVGLGIAQAIKLKNGDEKVFVFIGDMSATTGLFFECLHYSIGHDLPVTWVIGDNGRSVCTPTLETWELTEHPVKKFLDSGKVIYYEYESTFPHQGGGKHVAF